MNKTKKIRICDWSLLVLSALILAFCLQLEFDPSGSSLWVWIHIILGSIFMIAMFWHLYLHNWTKNTLAQAKRHPWLVVWSLLTLITGIIAIAHWYDTFTHTTIGGVHGKLGYIMIIAVAVHVKKHIRFYFKKKR